MSYTSPYNAYDPDQVGSGTPEDPWPVTELYMPGIVKYGQRLGYAAAPVEMDLIAGESIILELPTDLFIFIEPYVGLDDGYGGAGPYMESWKIDELLSYSFLAEATLGNCVPDMSAYYNELTKTMTLNGPFDMPTITNPDYPSLLAGCVPTFYIVPLPAP